MQKLNARPIIFNPFRKRSHPSTQRIGFNPQADFRRFSAIFTEIHPNFEGMVLGCTPEALRKLARG
jgi:hypothetical protein